MRNYITIWAVFKQLRCRNKVIINFKQESTINLWTTIQRQITVMFMKYFFLIAINIVNANAEKCVPGPFHKKYSSPATEERAACGAYNTDTCCTANFTNELNKTRGRVLLGFDWGHCKSISRVSPIFYRICPTCTIHIPQNKQIRRVFLTSSLSKCR